MYLSKDYICYELGVHLDISGPEHPLELESIDGRKLFITYQYGSLNRLSVSWADCLGTLWEILFTDKRSEFWKWPHLVRTYLFTDWLPRCVCNFLDTISAPRHVLYAWWQLIQYNPDVVHWVISGRVRRTGFEFEQLVSQDLIMYNPHHLRYPF